MVNGDRAHVDELCQVILVRNVVAMPRHYIEWRMLLRAAKKLAAELVHNLPWLFLDLILRNWV